jgi:hypothetical protein
MSVPIVTGVILIGLGAFVGGMVLSGLGAFLVLNSERFHTHSLGGRHGA